MKRDLGRLADRVFDVVIIGGGIYGACAAWDAALRGLSVALVEQGDFGHATSANSLKILHGGFRYLQSGDLARMRESIRERRALMRIAPHLNRRLPFLLPTYRRGIQRREVLRPALALYDLAAADRNRGIEDPQQRIPPGRIVSRADCLRLAPGLSTDGLTGGAIWYDGQVRNPERLTLAIIRSASEAGACVANYLQVTGLLQERGTVTGVCARDRRGGRQLTVRGRLVVNTSGPWVNRLLEFAQGLPRDRRVPFSKALNVVTRPLTDHALSVRVPHRGSRDGRHDGCCQRLHLTPWRGRTITGSLYVLPQGDGEAGRVTEGEVSGLVERLNAAYPGAALRADEVSFVHVGSVPRVESGAEANPYHLADRYQILDHGRAHGAHGLISVVGVKLTTARDVAENTVTLAMRRLGLPRVPSRSAATPVRGGAIERFEPFLAQALRAHAATLGEDVVRQLVSNYGSAYPEVMRYGALNPVLRRRLGETSATIRAEVVHAVREEMAQTLSDVVFRRTELGTLGHPGDAALRDCASVMADELGWDAARVSRELAETEQVFTDHGARADRQAPPVPAESAAVVGVVG